MPPDRPAKGGGTWVYRHTVLVRLAHWLNVACLVVLLLSGLQILCAHPAFYWGDVSDFAHPLAAVTAVTSDNGAAKGVTTLAGASFDTTGLLGVSTGADGSALQRAFPSWLTLPSELDLGAGRRWHFFGAWLFVANGALYLVSGLLTGRLRRTLLPTRAQLREIGRAVLDHLRLRFPRGEAARRYNVIQQLTYLVVVLVLLPLMLATGLSMSPTIDAWTPWLPALLGGRQAARTIHFVVASSLVLFAAVHVVLVLLSGPINEVRSMITGWFRLSPEKARP